MSLQLYPSFRKLPSYGIWPSIPQQIPPRIRNETPEPLMSIPLDLEKASSSSHQHSLSQTTNSDTTETRNSTVEAPNGRQLPPADTGRDAWLFLTGCFMFEALIWGFPFSFGVFQAYYTSHHPFSEHPRGVAVVGTCSTGVMYLFAPITLYALEKWPTIRRLCSVVGLIIVVAALLASSFATEVWHLIATQGVLYAIGGSLLYSPTMFYLDGWFVKRKGLAFGIMWSGVGTSGLIFPFLLTALLNTYGYATTLRTYAAILFTFCTPLIYYIKPRIPITKPTRNPASFPPPVEALLTSYSCALTPVTPPFIWHRTFITLQASNIIESLGFFLPAIFIPSFTRSAGMPAVYGTVLLAILNLFSVIGSIGLGALCDRLHVWKVIAISSFGATIAVFVFWGLGDRMVLLVIFVVVYGVSAGGYSAIWTGMMSEVQSATPSASMSTLMGLFSAGRGIGAVASGPISEVLLAFTITARNGTVGKNGSGGGETGYKSEYMGLIVFSGICALASELVCVGGGWWRRR